MFVVHAHNVLCVNTAKRMIILFNLFHDNIKGNKKTTVQRRLFVIDETAVQTRRIQVCY